MNLTLAYLNSNPQIKSAVFHIGAWYEEEYTIEILKSTSLHELYLTGTLPQVLGDSFADHLIKRCKEADVRLPQNLKYAWIGDSGLDSLSGKDWALIFTHCDYPTDFTCFKRLKPAHIVGSLYQEGGAFSIWEEFRKISRHIRIETLRANEQPKVLSWDCRDGNDVELSVIFPMYNIAQYLEQCLESVTKRSDDWVEFLFVNDGSPDNSREIVLEWGKKDRRIKLLDKENGGCASARQLGLDNAKGRYIGFIDPDDFIDGSMFCKLLRAALTGSYDIAYCGYNEFYETTRNTRRVRDLLGWPYDTGTFSKEHIWDLINYSPIAIWRRIYSAEFIRHAGIHFYTELRRFDDLPFNVEMFANARSVIAVPEHLYYYRLSRPGQDVSADDERLYVHFDIFRHLDETIAGKKDDELTDRLQIVKIATHRFAIGKIKKQFLKEYCRRAVSDMKKTGSFLHTYRIAKKRIGKRNALFYAALCFHFFSLAKRLA